MRKIIIIISVLVMCILISITYAYSIYKTNLNQVQKFNNEFSKYIKDEFYGNELATIINLAMDNNNKYNITKDTSGKYIEDELYSVRVDIYMTDTKKVYSMEKISLGNITNFVNNYSNIKFKTTKVEYHKKTKRISYLYIEQIS